MAKFSRFSGNAKYASVGLRSKDISVFFDIPLVGMMQDQYFGCLFFDVLRNLELPEGEDGDVSVAIEQSGSTRTRQVARLQQQLEKSSSGNLKNIDFEGNFAEAARSISRSNAAVVSSWVGELVAIFFNVPYVYLTGNSIFKKKHESIQNELLNKQTILVATKAELLVEKLQKIKDDFQYTAGMLEDFQATKELLGNHPSVRGIARHIIEKLED